MKRVTGFLLGLVVALAGASFAVTGGGFPSRPTFQAIGVGLSPLTTVGTIKASSLADVVPIKVGFSATGASNAGGVGFYDSNNVRTGFVGDNSAGSTSIAVISDTAACSTILQSASGGSIALNADTVTTTATTVPWTSSQIKCTTACNVSALVAGQSATIFKSSPTSRASNATVTDDPDLQFTNVPVGWYIVTENLQITGGTGGGFAGDLYTTGTLGTFFNNIALLSAEGSACGTITLGTSSIRTTATSDFGYTCTAAATTSTNITAIASSFPLTVTGSLKFAWAQNSSSATASSVNAGSTMTLTRVN